MLYGGQCGNGNSINLCKLSKYHHWEGWERYKHRAVAESVGTRQLERSYFSGRFRNSSSGIYSLGYRRRGEYSAINCGGGIGRRKEHCQKHTDKYGGKCLAVRFPVLEQTSVHVRCKSLSAGY